MRFSASLALTGLIVTTLIWGFEFVLIHNAIEVIEANTFNVLRFSVGAAVVMVFQKIRSGKWIATFNVEILKTATLLGMLLYIGFFAQTEGMHYTTVTNAGFITGMNVVLVPVLGTLFFKDKINPLVWFGVAIATLGLLLMTGLLSFSFNKGDMMIFICAVAFAFHINITGKVSGDHNVMDLAIIQMLVVALASAISALFLEDWALGLDPTILARPDIYSAILIAGALGTGFALIVQTWAQLEISPTRVGLVYSIEPVAAAAFGWLLLSENMGMTGLIGAALILTGMIISELPHDSWIIRWVKPRVH